MKGRNRAPAWYSITAEEWTTVQAALDTWLDPRNFDESGCARTSLTEATGRLW
jgi:hypothetical protein